MYHTGFETIREPDIHYGRNNTHFGQELKEKLWMLFAQELDGITRSR